jgi:hypothetical protein
VTRPFAITPNSTSVIRGISISNNIFFHSAAALLGYDAASEVRDVSIIGNSFRADGSTSGLAVRSCSNVVVSNNVFDGHSDYGINFGITGSTVSSISVMCNIFNNMADEAVEMGATTTNSATNVFYNNHLNGAVHNFKAFRTDDNSNIWNGTTAVTFNTSTLPDSFPMGISIATLNGDTGVPTGIGSTQGVLMTYRMSTISKATYQVFYHASNTPKLGSFWIRRRNQTVNSWTQWYEVTGS